MKIVRSSCSPEGAGRLQSEIGQAADMRGVTGRVCGASCATTCDRCGSTACQCRCSPECPDAPRALSSDPDLYPIEPGAVGLVYALSQTGLFSPCWSCEGHLSPTGDVWKTPTVWFYSEATAHVRLLADGLADLRHAGRLSTPWRVAVTFSDPDNPRTTFALEPVLEGDSQVSLRRLQDDADQIARALQTMLVSQGRALQRTTADALARARTDGYART